MNMLIRGIPLKYKTKIEKIAQSKNLSVNQVMVQLVIQSMKSEEEKQKAVIRQREAIRRLREMREAMYKKYGMSNDSVQMIREMRDSRNRDLL